MPIQFNNVSQSVRASHVYIELAGVKRSLASLFIPPIGGLVGQYDPLKTSVVDYEPVRVLSSDDVGNKFGFGSHIHRQAVKLPPSVYLQGGGIYAFPIPEEAGTAATANITIVGTATSAGTIFFSLGGVKVQIGVAIGDDQTVVANNLDTAVAAERDIAVLAPNTLGVCAVTAKFKGTAGNQILLKVNPGGEVQELQNPAGITVTISTVDGYLATGATDPSVEDAFFNTDGTDKLGDRWYTAFTMPFTDATNIAFYKAMAIKRADPAVNRMTSSYGAYVQKTYAQALALPATINSKHIGIIWDDRYEAPAFEMAAELTGIILDELNKAPNRPYKTLPLSGQVNIVPTNRRIDENDALFRAGMSYCNIDTSGTMRLGDVALTYRTNDSGGATEEWFDAVSSHNRQAKAYSIEQIFLADKFQRGVVTDNDAVTAVNFAIAPKDVVSEITKLIQDLWGTYSWSKNIDDIIKSITAEINSGNNSRIDSELIDDEARALRIIAIRYAYLY